MGTMLYKAGPPVSVSWPCYARALWECDVVWETGQLVWVWGFTDPHSRQLMAVSVLISHGQSQPPISCSAHPTPLLCVPEPRPGAGWAVRWGWSIGWGWAAGWDGQWGRMGNGVGMGGGAGQTVGWGWAMGWVGQWNRMGNGVSWKMERVGQ